MSPVTSNGPPHSRSTSVHVGGPVRTSNVEKLNGLGTMAGGSRVFPHYDDLKRARPNADKNSPIRTIIQEAEVCAKQAETQIDFRRPDLAFQEHLKASILVAEILPIHKDSPTLLAHTGELHRAYLGLQKRLKAQSVAIEQAVEAIKENNNRSGIKTVGNPEPNNELLGGRVNGHARAQSVQSPINTDSPRNTPNGYQSSERPIEGLGISIPTPTSAVPSPARKKPPVHPKPDALHGKALPTTNSSIPPRSPATDLETRFARLRGNVASTMQDARIQTRPITIPDSHQTAGQSPITARNSAIRPAGPREMPSAPTAILRPMKISVDVPMPAMPRPPDAIYSPERNTDSLNGLDLPTSAPRASPYLGSKGQTSAPPISTVGPSPSSAIPRSDYFTSFSAIETPGHSQTPSKRRDFMLPDATTVTREELMKYIGMGSQGLRLLVVDLRSRDEYDNGHIMAQSIICVEPIVLRDGMSADELGESIVLSPDTEQELYEQRQEFDLVVFYDQSSSSIGPNSQSHGNPNYLRDFAKAVFDYGYSKQLRRRPMLLIGGLDAWTDMVGQNALKTSSNSKRILKPARPLGRVPMARDTSRLQALARRPRESRPLSKEEELKWAETLQEEADVRMADGETPDFEEFSYVRTTEDFVRRFPELPSVQESMISSPTSSAMNNHHSELVSSVPRPPTRPAPALPRQRSSGISERGPGATYAMSAGTGPSTITSTPIPPGLTGLDTTGVTCYVNAVLQCLSAAKGLRDFLIHYNYPVDKLPPRKGSESSDPPQLLTRNLKKVYMSLWCGQYEWITPKTLWTQPPMSDRNNAFGGSGRQHDAQEFLIFIFDLMTDELNYKRNVVPYAQITNTDEQLDARNKLPPIEAAYHEWQLFQTTDDSLVSNLFGGLDMTSNTCQKCSYVSKRWTPFQSLNVNFPPNCHGQSPLGSIGLDLLFAHKYEHNELVHGVDCQNCKRKVDFVRSDKLSSVPEYLVVNLVRFENTGSSLDKVRTRVIFQEKDIDITRFWFGGVDTKLPNFVSPGLKPPFRYDCYAAVAHRGTSILSGHYLAFARSPDKPFNSAGSWHSFSDKQVHKSSWEEVQKHELTILFLKRTGV
ncbi:hypothetical protein OIDMADRAFT_29084 [Oidiodendron maius Zn]|uniref:USP domain-containing protein n=1 Tax=Oidiodendron maius (strain Zn) TaxID=913774 RepID=A0A0C3CQX3_OIDMZ|nr:hypothetical protein OIDMADRAFT_29084 [Oidiodendron maius Zn]